MIVDTSAVIAISLQEPGWEDLYQRILEADILLMSCGTLQELFIVAFRKGILAEVREFLKHLDLDYVPVNHELAVKGWEIYEQYGKGQTHPAQLNYGDCFAAAIATLRQHPILYAGQDFRAAGF